MTGSPAGAVAESRSDIREIIPNADEKAKNPRSNKKKGYSDYFFPKLSFACKEDIRRIHRAINPQKHGRNSRRTCNSSQTQKHLANDIDLLLFRKLRKDMLPEQSDDIFVPFDNSQRFHFRFSETIKA